MCKKILLYGFWIAPPFASITLRISIKTMKSVFRNCFVYQPDPNGEDCFNCNASAQWELKFWVFLLHSSLWWISDCSQVFWFEKCERTFDPTFVIRLRHKRRDTGVSQSAKQFLTAMSDFSALSDSLRISFCLSVLSEIKRLPFWFYFEQE